MRWRFSLSFQMATRIPRRSALLKEEGIGINYLERPDRSLPYEFRMDYPPTLLSEIKRFEALHEKKRFRIWLEVRQVDIGRFGVFWRKQIAKGDVKCRDFLLTAEGWLLIDP